MASDKEPVVVPVVREEASIARREVETGVVSVRKIVHERIEHIDEPLLHDEVEIEHVAINREVEAPEPPREEGGVLVVPIYEEVLTVQRRWVLKEEVRLRRREVRTRHREDVVLREEQVEVERRAADSRGSTQIHTQGETDVEDGNRADGQHRRGAKRGEGSGGERDRSR